MMFRFQPFPDKAGKCRIVFHNKDSHERLLSRLTLNRFLFSTHSPQHTR
jgi:hypothetical protein